MAVDRFLEAEAAMIRQVQMKLSDLKQCVSSLYPSDEERFRSRYKVLSAKHNPPPRLTIEELEEKLSKPRDQQSPLPEKLSTVGDSIAEACTADEGILTAVLPERAELEVLCSLRCRHCFSQNQPSFLRKHSPVMASFDPMKIEFKKLTLGSSYLPAITGVLFDSSELFLMFSNPLEYEIELTLKPNPWSPQGSLQGSFPSEVSELTFNVAAMDSLKSVLHRSELFYEQNYLTFDEAVPSPLQLAFNNLTGHSSVFMACHDNKTVIAFSLASGSDHGAADLSMSFTCRISTAVNQTERADIDYLPLNVDFRLEFEKLSKREDLGEEDGRY